MATSILMGREAQNRKALAGSEETRSSENWKQSGRKKSKPTESTQKKKQARRGMGVAELERLRIQEGKKSNPLHHLLPSSFPDPTRTVVPVHLANYTPYSAPNTIGDSGLTHPLLLPTFGNGGYHGFSGGSGYSGAYTDSLIVDPFGVGAPNQSFPAGNGIETSRELTSMPNISCLTQRCGVCHKKKRINGEIMSNGMSKDIHTDIFPINSFNFFGLNLESTRDLGAIGRVDKEAGVVAVHRKGSSSSSGRESVLMEYEFFPGKEGFDKEFKVGLSQVSDAEEASCFTTTASGFSVGVGASKSIDLSLKLSY